MTKQLHEMTLKELALVLAQAQARLEYVNQTLPEAKRNLEPDDPFIDLLERKRTQLAHEVGEIGYAINNCEDFHYGVMYEWTTHVTLRYQPPTFESPTDVGCGFWIATAEHEENKWGEQS